jgi:hypothetical protein
MNPKARDLHIPSCTGRQQNILSRECCVQGWSLLLSYARIFTMGVVSFLVNLLGRV